MKLTLEKAKEILKKHTTEDHLFTHAIAVSSAMGAMAEHFGEDTEYWRAIGYLHDVDYEKFRRSTASTSVSCLPRRGWTRRT